MTLPRFQYIATETIEEACSVLKEKGEKTMVMAGGTDLLVEARYHLVKPKVVIGIKKIKGLDRIVFDKKKGLTIGATALLADVASHPDVLETFPAIAYAAQETATVQIRNMGTVIGNLCNAAPSADNAPGLIAMGAEVTVMGPDGEKRVPLGQFFKGPGTTVLERGEIVVYVFVPLPPPNSGASYQHISARSKVDISAVGVGVLLAMKKQMCKDVKIVLGAVAPVPMRAIKAEELIKGKQLTPYLIEKTGIQASQESKPISDVRASAEYRRKMVAVLTKRALLEAKERALKR